MAKLSDDLRASKKAKFLEAYCGLGIIGPCCTAADISRSTYNNWRDADEIFDAACDEAYLVAIELAEMELRARAVDGIEEPVLYKGEPVWKRDPATGNILLDDETFDPIPFTTIRKSDDLLKFFIKGHMENYREKGSLEVTGKGGKDLNTPLTIQYVLPDGKTMEDYDNDPNNISTAKK